MGHEFVRRHKKSRGEHRQERIRRWEDCSFPSSGDTVKKKMFMTPQDVLSDIFSCVSHEGIQRSLEEREERIERDEKIKEKWWERIKSLVKNQNVTYLKVLTPQERNEDKEREVEPHELVSFIDFLRNVQAINDEKLRRNVMNIALNIRERSKHNLRVSEEYFDLSPFEEVLLCYKYGLRNFAGLAIGESDKTAWDYHLVQGVGDRRSAKNKIREAIASDPEKENRKAKKDRRSENRKMTIGGQGFIDRRNLSVDVYKLGRRSIHRIFNGVKNAPFRFIVPHGFCADVFGGDLKNIDIIGNTILYRIRSMFDVNVEGDLHIEESTHQLDLDEVLGDMHVEDASGSISAQFVQGNAVVETGKAWMKFENVRGAAIVHNCDDVVRMQNIGKEAIVSHARKAYMTNIGSYAFMGEIHDHGEMKDIGASAIITLPHGDASIENAGGGAYIGDAEKNAKILFAKDWGIIRSAKEGATIDCPNCDFDTVNNSNVKLADDVDEMINDVDTLIAEMVSDSENVSDVSEDIAQDPFDDNSSDDWGHVGIALSKSINGEIQPLSVQDDLSLAQILMNHTGTISSRPVSMEEYSTYISDLTKRISHAKDAKHPLIKRVSVLSLKIHNKDGEDEKVVREVNNMLIPEIRYQKKGKCNDYLKCDDYLKCNDYLKCDDYLNSDNYLNYDTLFRTKDGCMLFLIGCFKDDLSRKERDANLISSRFDASYKKKITIEEKIEAMLKEFREKKGEPPKISVHAVHQDLKQNVRKYITVSYMETAARIESSKKALGDTCFSDAGVYFSDVIDVTKEEELKEEVLKEENIERILNPRTASSSQKSNFSKKVCP